MCVFACSDASEHFGKCLLPLLPALARSDGSKPFEEQTDIPEELRGAIIACHGHLTPSMCTTKLWIDAHLQNCKLCFSFEDFDYISTLREANERAKLGRNLRMTRAESFVTVDLHGHLFDTGAMAKVCVSLASFRMHSLVSKPMRNSADFRYDRRAQSKRPYPRFPRWKGPQHTDAGEDAGVFTGKTVRFTHARIHSNRGFS